MVMSEKWEHKGNADGPLGWLAGGCGYVRDELVENTETGEQRTVFTVGDQTVGEAIAEGQFKDK